MNNPIAGDVLRPLTKRETYAGADVLYEKLQHKVPNTTDRLDWK